MQCVCDTLRCMLTDDIPEKSQALRRAVFRFNNYILTKPLLMLLGLQAQRDTPTDVVEGTDTM